MLLTNIGELVTFQGKTAQRGKAMAEPLVLHNVALRIEGEHIVEILPMDQLSEEEKKSGYDCQGKLVTPGFVDSHTHFIFGGSRAKEAALRRAGASYMDIMEAGGGIQYTVDHTRKASFDELYCQGEKRLNQFLSLGITTVEGKSGYGLDEETELRQLEVMAKLKEDHPMDIALTYMGPHALPREYKDRQEEFMDFQCDVMLPKVKDLVDFADIFTEKNVFELEESKRYLKAAKDLGIKRKVHADEIVTLGGAELAVAMEATSADHLLQVSEEGIKALAQGDTIATLLPLTAFSLKEDYAPARRLIDAGCAVALATDYNPGSCHSMSLPLLIALATNYMSMSMEETLCALTLNGAAAMDKADEVGSLESGKKADILLHDAKTLDDLPYFFAMNSVEAVMKAGKWVVDDKKKLLFVNQEEEC